MVDRDRKIVEKILNHVCNVIRYNEDVKTLGDFQDDPMRVDATVFNLMQIGELAKSSLSEEAKDAIRTIPWQQLYGMRNRIVHGYSGVHLSIVWETVQEDMPRLKAELESILVQGL